MKENHKPAPDLTIIKQAASSDKPQQLCSMLGASCSLRREEPLSPRCSSPVLFRHMSVDRCDQAQSSLLVQSCCQRRERVEEGWHFLAAASSAPVMGTQAPCVTHPGTQAPLCPLEALILMTHCHKAGTFWSTLSQNIPSSG